MPNKNYLTITTFLFIFHFALTSFAGNSILYDFESGNPSWFLYQDGEEKECETSEYAFSGQRSLVVPFENSKQARVLVRPDDGWTGDPEISFYVRPPDNMEGTLEAIVYFKDRDYWWYQRLLKQKAKPGEWTQFNLELTSPDISSLRIDERKHRWQSVGHDKPWEPYNLLRVREFGIILLSKTPLTGVTLIDRIEAVPAPEIHGSTVIKNISLNRVDVPRYNMFEVRFGLSRIYSNPFDPEIVDIKGIITSPSGREDTVHGFFMQDYRRIKVDGFQKLMPVGDTTWAIRYAPSEIGEHSLRIELRDKYGVCLSSPVIFRSVHSESQGYISVSEMDMRWFEYTNGDFYYPVGHSVHATVDEHYHRMQKLPLPALDLRTYYYDEIFAKMEENSENITEIWMAPWVFELEWNDNWSGYAGIGMYNMERAWELDYMVFLAEKHSIHLQIALTNHGQLSETTDIDWMDSPYNVDNGGFLKSTTQFFSDERAIELHKQKLRYIIARYGWSTGVFGWELISESDLVGTYGDFSRTPEVVNWMKVMSEYIHEIDYAGHPVTNHYYGDYSRGISAVFNLPSIDYVACDAYCNGQDFIQLVYDTSTYNSRYGKPILITEYGLDWCGGSDNLMKAQLHAGMWSAWMTQISGTPMFWWHIFIDDHDLYFYFKAFAKFIKGEERRGEKMETSFLHVTATEVTSEDFRCLARKGRDSAYLWVYNPRSCPQTSYWENIKYFQSAEKIVEEEWQFEPVPGLVVELSEMDPLDYRVEIWDTREGTIEWSGTLRASGTGILKIPLSPVERDVAVKVKGIQSVMGRLRVGGVPSFKMCCVRIGACMCRCGFSASLSSAALSD